MKVGHILWEKWCFSCRLSCFVSGRTELIRYRMADDEDLKRHIAAEMVTKYYGVPDDEDACMLRGNLFTDEGESAQSRRDEELGQVRARKIAEAKERKCTMSNNKERRGSYLSGFVKKIKSLDENKQASRRFPKQERRRTKKSTETRTHIFT